MVLLALKGQTECKKNPYGKPKNTPTNVAVIGAGLMGAGVTEVSVANGFDATLKVRHHYCSHILITTTHTY